MSKLLFLITCLIVFANCFATKVVPLPLSEVFADASIVAEVRIQQASVSDKIYTVVHSGENKPLLHYKAVYKHRFKGERANKAVIFYSKRPLLVGTDYLVFLNENKNGGLFVGQAGFAAFEIAFIDFEDQIQKSLRIPEGYIVPPKEIPTTKGVTKLNEVFDFTWIQWEVFKTLYHNSLPSEQ